MKMVEHVWLINIIAYTCAVGDYYDSKVGEGGLYIITYSL